MKVNKFRIIRAIANDYEDIKYRSREYPETTLRKFVEKHYKTIEKFWIQARTEREFYEEYYYAS